MKEEFKNFLKTTQDIKIQSYNQGWLFYDRKALGATGYLLKNRKIIKVPVPITIISKKV